MRVDLKGLEVGYGVKAVLQGVELSIPEGSLVGILGPNGSGKTTLLKTMAKLLKPLGGSVFLGGKDLSSMNNLDMARRVSVVLTEVPSMGLFTVEDVVAMGRYPHTGFLGKLSGKDREIVREAMERVRILDLSQRPFNELSDGEKQKVLLARALAQEPRVMILDEPTSHLDPKHSFEIMDILRELAGEFSVTVVASLHSLELASRFCDLLVLVGGGKLMAFGRPEEVLRKEFLKKLYGIDGFDDVLGVFETKGKKKVPLFVVSGAGSGVPVFRAISRLGFTFYTGIVHRGDIDFFVARAKGIDVIAEEPYKPISPGTYKAALEKISSVEIVVDTGFPLGEFNRKNMDLLEEAKNMGKEVFSLRKGVEIETLLGVVKATFL